MRERYITRPNIIDLFVVVATCLLVLFLAFPLHSTAEACGAQVTESVASAPVVRVDQQKRVEKAEPVAKKKQAVRPEPREENAPEQMKAEAVQAQADKVGVDIETLKTRLKETDAIGVFTKLAIRGDILDLVDQIKRYRKQAKLEAKLAEVRASFDGLLLKMVALLEEDPSLSRDLYVSRESIWKSILEVKV